MLKFSEYFFATLQIKMSATVLFSYFAKYSKNMYGCFRATDDDSANLFRIAAGKVLNQFFYVTAATVSPLTWASQNLSYEQLAIRSVKWWKYQPSIGGFWRKFQQ